MLLQPIIHLFAHLQVLPAILNQIDVPQVIFIQTDNPSIDPSVFSQLSSLIPTYQVSLINETLALNYSSALFVWLKDPWVSLDIETQNILQLRQMSFETFQSKFLILQPNSDNCETFLRLAWENSFIDFTILDPQSIHYYNPFTNSFFHIQPNTSTIFFPDKLRDLHNYHLKVGILDYPPYSSVKSNIDGTYKYTYIFGNYIENLAKRANFIIEPEVVSLKDYGIIHNDVTASGLIGKVWAGKLDLLAFAAFVFYSPSNSKTQRTTYLIIDKGCPVVPLIPLTSTEILTAQSLQYSIITIVVLVVVVYIFSRLLRLDKRLWHVLNILFLILGISVSDVPKLLRERFLYGCIMIISLFYSSNIFAQLTSINVASAGYQPFESFEDLNKSGLIPVMHPNAFNMTFEFTDNEYLKSLGKKVDKRADIIDCCPNWLTGKKNVTCIFEKLMADLQVKGKKDSEGKDLIKIGKPCFYTVSRSFRLPPGSPFTNRFDQIIRRIEQAGLHNPWFTEASHEYNKLQHAKEEDEKEEEKKKAKSVLEDSTYNSAKYWVVVGCIGSTVVFIGELLIFHVKKWRARAKIFAYTE